MNQLKLAFVLITLGRLHESFFAIWFGQSKVKHKQYFFISFFIMIVHVSFGHPPPLAWLLILIPSHFLIGALSVQCCMRANHLKRFFYLILSPI